MNLGIHPFRAALAVAAAGCLIAGVAQPATAAPPDSVPSGVPQLEALDRGLVAVSTSEGVFLSWRLLASEATGATDTGLAGPDFAVYRDGERVAVVTDSTNYADAAGSATAQYTVAPVVNGIELAASAPVSAWAQGYTDLPLQKPADGVTPPTVIPNVSTSYTYSANDVSVADVDGDGAYEYVVKWDPSNSKDVSQRGWTGPVYIDTYELDGTLLNRLDLGVNIRAGAHYTQFLVYDFDGDGRSETMLKTAPGTKSITYNPDGTVASEQYITMPEEDLEAGYAQTDDYRMSAADYQDHLAEMFQGWTEHPEVVAGNWPATLEEAWGIPVTHEYPLSEADAEQLADYFIDVYAPSRSANNRLREFEGFIVDGPEYLTVFDSATGEELQTIPYKTARDDDGLLWGDYAMARVEPGNRVDRFLSGVGYFDGQHPSAVFARGYYTRTTITTYDWDGESLSERWYVDSGHVPMTNPFNDAPHGRDGTNPEFATITTQGDHSLSLADVDGDGKQELVYGSATFDDDGSLLYSSFDVLPPGSAAPGAKVRLGHGDAMHVTDIDPSRDGIEVWTAHEGATGAPYGSAMRDAATGETLFGAYSGRDTGRAMIGDVRSDVPGIEVWSSLPGGTDASGLVSATGRDPLGRNSRHEHVDPLVGRPHDADRERQRHADADDRRLDAWAAAHRDRHAHEQRHEGQPVARRRRLRRLARGTPRSHGRLDRAAHLHEHGGHDAQADDPHARRAVPRRDRPPADHLQPAGLHVVLPRERPRLVERAGVHDGRDPGRAEVQGPARHEEGRGAGAHERRGHHVLRQRRGGRLAERQGRGGRRSHGRGSARRLVLDRRRRDVGLECHVRRLIPAVAPVG